MENNNNNNQNENADNNKVAVQYEKNIKKLVAIVGGKENLSTSKKVKKDILSSVVTELLADDRKTAAENIKTEIKDLLAKKVACDKEIKKFEDDLAQLKIKKNKEFNEAATKVFAKIEGLDTIEKDFYATLGVAAAANADAEDAKSKIKGGDEEG